ncbi:hypothetical protein Uis4E_1893 [Bifidobacterium parmae]|uniref:Uncharacterized protein n=1 Tax=Bifidobacterium parmae TaxID=361854 RepID=A0A2N5IWJ1_9BIFI|nr:hypothetical protein Uis4E_1893 [Bifidobacterium parmae]
MNGYGFAWSHPDGHGHVFLILVEHAWLEVYVDGAGMLTLNVR